MEKFCVHYYEFVTILALDNNLDKRIASLSIFKITRKKVKSNSQFF